MVLLGPWYAWSHAFARLDEDYQSQLSLAVVRANWNRVGPILTSCGHEFLSWDDWGPFWIMLPIFAALGYRGFASGRIRVLWLVLLSQFAVYVLAYLIAPADLMWLLPHSFDRLVIQMTPVAILLMGFHWRAMGGEAIEARPTIEKTHG
jgi:hypothetical protein